MRELPKKVMLGCWGIGGSLRSLQSPHFNRLTIDHGPFAGRAFPSATDLQMYPHPRNWHLPPLARFTPDGIDFMSFILYDKVTIDNLAFECMLARRRSLMGWKPHKESVAILESLAADGHIIIENYASKLSNPEAEELIDSMVSFDLSDPNIIMTAKQSLSLWMQFCKDVLGATDSQLSGLHRISSSLESGSGPVADAFDYLYQCVADIDQILVLSQLLDQPIYDWEDYRQYYKYKFLRAGQTVPERPPEQTLLELFNVFIPNFQIKNYAQLLDIRHDYRLDAVRKLATSLGGKPIRKDLVIKAYEDVLKIKSKMETFSNYVGYAGYLLNIFPGCIGSTLQVTANLIAKKWLERNIKWQAFFVERAVQHPKKKVEEKLRQQM